MPILHFKLARMLETGLETSSAGAHLCGVCNIAAVGDTKPPLRATPANYTKTKWRKNPLMQSRSACRI